MPFKQEPCRNFQRGSCHYGEWCKFLHVTQQRSKQNPFGFGVQNGSNFQQANSQQQKQNPFGFGVKNSTQPKPLFGMGSKQNQFKPFENKWTRLSATPGNSPSFWQPDNQPQVGNHECTDPDSCKRLVEEDLTHERPLWKLTCYGHRRSSCCDVTGDISYEELRSAAYNDAKSGLSLPAIAERERSLLNAKLNEFESFLQKPYAGRSDMTPSLTNAHPSTILSASGPSSSPTVSSFSQLGASVNMWPAMRNSVPTNNALGLLNSLQTSNQSTGSCGDQFLGQTANISLSSKSASFMNTIMTVNNSSFSPAVVPSEVPMLARNPSSVLPPEPHPPSDVINQADSTVPLPSNSQAEEKNIGNYSTIWMKENWSIGEIPEEAPPDAYVTQVSSR